MADIEGNVARLRERIATACRQSVRDPDAITIVAVTKTVKPVDIIRAHQCNITNFAENRVQEAEFKIKDLSHLRQELAWHLIGRLQSNKVGLAVGLFDVIQSVDSLKLAETVSGQTQKTLPVLLQVNISGEASKGGFTVAEVESRVAAIKSLPRLEVRGLMTIAPTGADAAESRRVFRELRQLRDKFGLQHLSMGMSDDFEIAIAEGATMIRIGRAIFGERA